MTNWYEKLFANYARQYDNESFTKGTVGECDFIELEIEGDRQKRILDIGCGTGRHAIEISRRGYAVTGVDLSMAQILRAREKAQEAGVTPRFLQADARQLEFAAEFELAIMLCEGGFPLMETDEMNYEILRGAARALVPGGKLIMTTLNGLFPLFHSVRDFFNAVESSEGAQYSEHSFDLMTFRDHNVTRFVDDDGVEHEIACDERYYVPSEITWLLRSLGFGRVEFFGAKLGAFSREHKLTTSDFEMLVVASLPT